jgi:hypothetical protein
MTIPRFTVLMVGAAILLAGCAPSGPSQSTATKAANHQAGSTVTPMPTVSATPKAAPSATAAALPPTAIIRVTATVTASTGAVARLVETVLAPAPATGGEQAAMSAADCEYGDWAGQFPHPDWAHVSVTTTLVSGSSWPSEDAVLTFSGTSIGWVAWAGQVHGFEAPCSDGILDIPGSASAIVPVDPAAAAGTARSATGGSFGFVWASDADDPSDMHFAFTGCTIEAGPAAGPMASAFVRVPAFDGYPQMCSTPGS